MSTPDETTSEDLTGVQPVDLEQPGDEQDNDDPIEESDDYS